ncbi:xenotropic and polytropic retrovirus receptor 1 homolog [Tachysurus ichikawai]
MKFTEHLAAHITPEWRKQYIQYEAFKEMLYSAQDQAPSIEGKYQSLCIRYQREFYRIALHPSNDEFRGISNTNRGIKTS